MTDTHPARSPGTLHGADGTAGGKGKTIPGTPRISVVTVVFNGESRLEEAIRSVLRQDYDNLEYIVVDGGSTDGTLDIVRRYEGRIGRWISEPDRGIYDAMNKGISLASGDLIGFLNSDDWYEPGAVAAVAASWAGKDRENTVVAGAWNLVFDDIGVTVRATPSLRFHAGMPLSHQALFVPRSVYESIGKYDVRYRYAADLDMALRLRARNVRFRFVDDVLVNFRTSGASERHSRESGREASEIIRRHLPFRSWCLFRVLRWKYETLSSLSRTAERLLGKRAAGSLKSAYFRIKALYSRNWRMPP